MENMTITTRFTVSIVLITTFCMLLFGGYQYTSIKNRLYGELTGKVERDLDSTRVAIAEPLYNYDDPTINGIIRAIMNNESLLSIIVYSLENGKEIPSHGYYRDGAGAVTQGVKPVAEEGMLVSETDLSYYDSSIGKIVIQASITQLKYKLHQMLIGELLRILILNIILILFIVTVVRSRFLRPIIALTNAAQDIADGNLSRNIELDSDDEIGQLSRSLVTMKNSILSQLQTLEERNFELFRSQKDLSTTLNSIGDAVIATDAQGRIVRMNPVAEELTGWKLEDAREKLLQEVFVIINADTRDLCGNPVEIVLSTETIVGLANHTLLIAKDKTEYHIADSGAPIRDESGEIIGVVLVFRDVTKEYALENQLLQSQKLEAVGQLAGGVAHDFNNMLGGIIGSADLLGMYLSDDPKARKYHNMILDAAERAAGLTQNLLTFARTTPRASTVINIHELLIKANELLENTLDKGIRLQVELLAENSSVVADPSQLQSVFLNLGINGSHAMPEGGILDISSINIELDDVYCRLSTFDLSPGSYLEIEIRDTGQGIDPVHISRIFDPFFTTKEQGKGTGLGLAVAYGAIKQHQGAITVYSEPGSGTVFNILLPLAEGSVVKKARALNEFKKGTGRILVVDDEDLMRVTAEAILENLGYEVLVAKDGQHAMEIYSKQEKEIDLVLLDMVMPVMNGRECFSALKKYDSDVKVIISSGFSQEENLNELKSMGLLGFIRKPYRSVDLSRIVHDALANKED
ncbi:MAG: PAS domain S-box-containing protein [Desulforhopalus sp.]